MEFQIGDKVRVTPDPSLFSDPTDYGYIMKDGIAEEILTVVDILPPTPKMDFLPRSGMTLYALVDNANRKAYLAAKSEMEKVDG